MAIVSCLAKKTLETASSVRGEQSLSHVDSELREWLGSIGSWLHYIHAWDVNQAEIIAFAVSIIYELY